MTLWRSALWPREDRWTTSARFGVAVLVFWTCCAVVSPWWGYPVGADVAPALASRGVGWAHPLGTDHLGRDVAARLLLASQSWVWPGLLAATVGGGLGAVLGGPAGYLGGAWALAVRYGAGVLAGVPRFVWVLLWLTVCGDTAVHLGFAVGLALTPDVAESVRARVEAARSDELVAATIAHGESHARVLWLYLVLGLCGRQLVAHGLRGIALTAVMESTLSYIGGYGVREPFPSWGNMLAFEWGRALGPSVWAPALALLITLAACGWAAQAFEESPHA